MSPRSPKFLKIIGGTAAVVLVVLFIIWGFLFFSTEQYVSPYDPADKASVREAQIQAFVALVQLFGGIFLIGTIYSALQSLRLTEEGLLLSREQLNVSQQELQATQELTRDQIRVSREGQ